MGQRVNLQVYSCLCLREVEGQIFRIGMHLEDIKEQIDRNICHVYYPPTSSSTPSPPPCENIPLSPSHPSLHEVTHTVIYIIGDIWTKIHSIRQYLIVNDTL